MVHVSRKLIRSSYQVASKISISPHPYWAFAYSFMIFKAPEPRLPLPVSNDGYWPLLAGL